MRLRNSRSGIALRVRVLAAVAAIFYFPLEMIRFGVVGGYQLALHEYRVRCGLFGGIVEGQASELRDVDGVVRIIPMKLAGYSGELLLVRHRPAFRPGVVREILFWLGGEPPVLSEDMAEAMGLPHEPRPARKSDQYINALVMSDRLREKVQTHVSEQVARFAAGLIRDFDIPRGGQ